MIEHVADYYNRNPQREVDRLESPLGRIEFLSTLRLIDKHFPGRGRLLDIGGGGGRYCLELAKRGYDVTLRDLSTELVENARAAFAAEGLTADGFTAGDARDLSIYADASFDAALLLGPCYHLIDRADRLRALTEMKRVLKPGGVAIVAYLNAWGLIKTGLSDFPRFLEDLKRCITDANGRYAFAGLNPASQLFAVKGGLAAHRINIPANGANVDLTLSPNLLATISGTVTDMVGKPIPRVMVSLLAVRPDLSLLTMGMLTDSAGRYRFDSVFADGRYRLMVNDTEPSYFHVRRYAPATATPGTLTPNGVTTVLIRLRTRV